MGILAATAYLLTIVAKPAVVAPSIPGLAWQNPRTTAFMDRRDAQTRAQGRRPYRFQVFVPYRRISPYPIHAVLIAEDSSFFRHHGIKYGMIPWCLVQDFRKDRWAYGCSTITQQLAKNLFLSPKKTILRKASEALITRELEMQLSKQRILELYLNYIEWGEGIYGCEAAARHYFRTTAADLTPEQAIRLAAIIMNPRRYGPYDRSPEVAKTRRAIAADMHEAGYLDDDEYEELPFG